MPCRRMKRLSSPFSNSSSISWLLSSWARLCSSRASSHCSLVLSSSSSSLKPTMLTSIQLHRGAETPQTCCKSCCSDSPLPPNAEQRCCLQRNSVSLLVPLPMPGKGPPAASTGALGALPGPELGQHPAQKPSQCRRGGQLQGNKGRGALLGHPPCTCPPVPRGGGLLGMTVQRPAAPGGVWGLAKLQLIQLHLQLLQCLLQLLLLLLTLCDVLFEVRQGLLLCQEPDGDVLARGEHRDSAQGTPAEYRIWAVALGRFLHQEPLQAHVMEQSSSIPACTRGTLWGSGDRGEQITPQWNKVSRQGSAPWGWNSPGFYQRWVFTLPRHRSTALQPWPSPSSPSPRPHAPAGTWWPPVWQLGWEGSGREGCPWLRLHPPLHPARYSPTSGSSVGRLTKPPVKSRLACSKDVHHHPRAAGTLGELALQPPTTHGRLGTDACNPACARSPSSPLSEAFLLLP